MKFESYVKARVGWHGLKSDDFTDGGPYLVTGTDFFGSRIDWANCHHCDDWRYDQDPYIQLREGDLLITKDGTIGKLALVEGLNGKATLNSGVFVVRPLRNRYTNRFYFWLLQSSAFNEFVNYRKTGSTIVHLYQETFVNFSYALPPLPEQTQIAKFLDYETAKIDALIAKQQQIIALLQEKRQAVISHAVTKGLNPAAPLRDSGVAWLGAVPAHWEVGRLKYFASTTNGFGFSSSDFQDEGIPFIRAGNIKKWSVTPPNIFLPEKIVARYDRLFLKEGEVIISMVGSDPKVKESAVGQVGIVPSTLSGSVPNQNVVIMREYSSRMKKRFLFHTLCSSAYRNHLDVFSHKLANQSIISSSLIVAASVCVPPLAEQDAILKHLEKQLPQFDKLVFKAEEAIDLLQERRTALISAAVTGKIDVRGWQSPLASHVRRTAHMMYR